MAEKEGLVYTTLAAIGVVGAVILANKVREKILAVQIAKYNIDLLKQKKEILSKENLSEKKQKAINAATKLRGALEDKIRIQKEYQAKIEQAQKNGTPIEKIRSDYAKELAKVNSEIATYQAEYNLAQGESLSLQQESFDISKDLKSNLSSIPGILGLITSGFQAILIKRKANITLGKKENAVAKEGAVAESAKGAASQGL